MTRLQSTTVMAIPAVLLLALTGCFGTPDPAAPGESSGTEGGEADGGSSSADCLIDRIWNVDVDDLASQLLTHMQSLGSPATSATGTGSMTIMFGEDTLVNATADLTFVMMLPVDNGPTMTVTQRQQGGGLGSWFWDGDRPGLVVFEDWEGGYDIDMTMAVDGTVVDVPIDVPTSAAGGTDMTVSCEGDTLTTTPEGSPFTQRWTTTS